MVSTQRSSNHHSLPVGMYTGEELHDVNEKITPTDYEALRFVLLAPFSLEGGNEATYSAEEIDVALGYAGRIKASLDTAERERDELLEAVDRWRGTASRLAETNNQRNAELEDLRVGLSYAAGEVKGLTALAAGFQAERDAWKERALATERERDELREALVDVYNAFGYTWPARYVEDIGTLLGRDDTPEPTDG